MPAMANESGKFVVYKSSAGSGKTFTLVREYLKIVLQNPEQFRQVLAITFTNKAANELKERVVRNLIFLADPGNNRQEDAVKYLLPQLVTQINLTEAQISSRASVVLRLIMHHYSEFAISTIDSFTHRVIRTFAHDLKIPMNFEVELDAETMLSQSVDLLINEVGSDEQLTRVMVDFVEKKAGDEQNWQIERDLNEFAGTLLSESSIDAIGEIRKYDLETFMKVRNKLVQWKSIWENTVKKLALEAVELINREHLTIDSFIQKKNSILVYLQNLAQGNFDKIKPNSYARTSLESGEWISPKATPGDRAAFDRIAPQLMTIGTRLLEIINVELPRYTLCKLLLNQLFSTALLSEIEKTLNELCLENNKLLISEFNRRIAEVVKEQPAPFIYERLGEKYHHYLIDEFQDTSILQWHNLLPLVENSLASSRLNLVVGDAKQAIYRWRSGDAEQFELLPKLLKDEHDPLLDSREQALINNYRNENLASNHRSSPVIVDFNNRLFTSIAPFLPERYGAVFSHAGQEAARQGKQGMVRVEKVVKAEEDDRNYEDVIHDKILSIINELQADNFPLKDIAVLCRENKKASKIASFLIRSGIPVISSESLLLTQSEKVNFLVAWMKYLVERTDVISHAHIFNFLIAKELITGVVLEDIFSKDHAQPRDGFGEILSKHCPFIDIKHMKNLEIFGLTQYLILHFGLNNQDDSYLRFFQDVVLEFVKDHRGGLPEFLEWWEEKKLKASVVIPEGIDAVRIMTIHKAKGLQFPAVIYPYADEKVKATRKNLWVTVAEDFAEPLKTAYLPTQAFLKETVYEALYEDEMDRSAIDMVNVLYVALTRPEERLYVLSKDFPEKTDGPYSVPKLLSRFLMAEGTWEKSRNLYQYGERWQRDKVDKKSESSINPVDEQPSFSDSLKMLLRRHAPAAWDIEEPEKNREWGNLVHEAMSKIGRADQVGTVLQEMLAGGLINSRQQDELTALMDGILKDPEVSGFFDPAFEVRNEPEILTPGGILYRPDRVLIQNGRATIIDYKTGKQHAWHRDQVIQYAGLLEEMNYKVDGAYLLYLNRQPDIVKVV
jgi:ATP-dependent exoDNAse (exonuclease V) beta subunit